MNINDLCQTGFTAGIVALLGRPNVGKSSLVNRLVGEKVNIVSPKPQTTRDNILCVLNAPDLQVVFRDMPGVHTPRHDLGRYLVETARNGLDSTDLVLYMVEAGATYLSPDDQLVNEMLSSTGVPFILLINKIDLVKKDHDEIIASSLKLYGQGLRPLEVLPVSAKSGKNLDRLVEILRKNLPQGHPFYPEDILVDCSERFLASEYIREKIFQLTEMEVPHSTAVKIEEYKSPDEYPERKDLYIRADIFVERSSQKKIIIGSGGNMIKKIGLLSRKEIEKLTGYKVYLDLWVRVKKDWRKSPLEVRRMGYH